MTALESRQHQLLCNAPARHADIDSAFFQAPIGTESTTSLTQLRKLAVKAGWTYVPSKYGRMHSRDYCPEHKPTAT